MGEPTIGNRRCPSALGEDLCQLLQARPVGDADRPALERHVVAEDGDTEGAPGVALDIADLARPRYHRRSSTSPSTQKAPTPVMCAPSVCVGRREPEGVMVGSPGAGFLRQVRRESPAHIIPLERGEVVEVGEVLRVGFGCHITTTTCGIESHRAKDPHDAHRISPNGNGARLPGPRFAVRRPESFTMRPCRRRAPRCAPARRPPPLPRPHRHRRHGLLRARRRHRPHRRRIRRRADPLGTTIRRRRDVVRQFVSGVPVRRTVESLLLLLRSQPGLDGDLLQPTRDRALPAGDRRGRYGVTDKVSFDTTLDSASWDAAAARLAHRRRRGDL